MNLFFEIRGDHLFYSSKPEYMLPIISISPSKTSLPFLSIEYRISYIYLDVTVPGDKVISSGELSFVLLTLIFILLSTYFAIT